MDSTKHVTSRYTRTTRIVPASSPAAADTATVRRALATPLQLVVHEYAIHNGDRTPDVNVVLTHGTSFNRHFWTLVIDDMLSWLEEGPAVGRLVAIDAANHGDSAVLNGQRLPSTACWADDSRDIIHVVKHLSLQERPVIGIGHSFGGGAMCHAALMDPALFATTILVEPILFQMKEQTEALADMTLKRRSQWASKEAVAASFSKNPAFKDWDPRQMRVYANDGTFSPNPDDPSRVLKTPKEQEAATYRARPHPRILELIQDARQPLHFIWGADSTVISAARRDRIAQMLHPPSTSQAIAGAGHLIPMSHPEPLARILAGLLRNTNARRHHERQKL